MFGRKLNSLTPTHLLFCADTFPQFCQVSVVGVNLCLALATRTHLVCLETLTNSRKKPQQQNNSQHLNVIMWELKMNTNVYIGNGICLFFSRCFLIKKGKKSKSCWNLWSFEVMPCDMWPLTYFLGIDATIRTRQEIQCLPYAGFFCDITDKSIYKTSADKTCNFPCTANHITFIKKCVIWMRDLFATNTRQFYFLQKLHITALVKALMNEITRLISIYDRKEVLAHWINIHFHFRYFKKNSYMVDTYPR